MFESGFLGLAATVFASARSGEKRLKAAAFSPMQKSARPLTPDWDP
ncbi:MAG: hypothetical protein OHK0012_01770 [Synechococcales cyanobacterium]